jgi:16S rRNA U516 pseudouridylate synthase RsuA-like enzyme
VQDGQLRDMCAQVGLDVVSIRRLRIGKIPLGKGPNGAMPPGQWRYLPVGERFYSGRMRWLPRAFHATPVSPPGNAQCTQL